MTRAEFEGLVAEALDSIPTELAGLMSNLVVVVEDTAPDDDPDLLGLYAGIPLTERDGSYAGFLPDQVSIFMAPILGMCETHADVVEEVRITVVHEVAHHFGIDDARLEELGYA